MRFVLNVKGEQFQVVVLFYAKTIGLVEEYFVFAKLGTRNDE